MSIRQQRAQQIARKRKIRYGKAKLHKFSAYASVSVAIVFLAWFFVDITSRALPAFEQANLYTTITYDGDILDMTEDDFFDYQYATMATEDDRTITSQAYLRSLIQEIRDNPALGDTTYTGWVRADARVDKYLKFCAAEPASETRRDIWNDVIWRADKRLSEINDQLSGSALPLTAEVNTSLQNERLLNQSLITETEAKLDRLNNKDPELVAEIRAECSKLTVKEVARIEQLVAEDKITMSFNTEFFTNGSYTEAEYAGFIAAMVGSVMVLFVTMCLCIPIGVATAIYLEEFASDNWFTRAVEVNINNLAAVPSIIFGLLGLAVFQIAFDVWRGSAIIGGLTLALMTLPVIVIATRAALRSVPEYIRIGAYGLGCTRWRVVRDHVLPLALPGILTGSIIGLAQAMGETAPLIMIGLIANVSEVSPTFTQQTTVMPAQIFEWFGRSDNSFKELAALAILILLAILLSMNAIAVFLRRRFERRW